MDAKEKLIVLLYEDNASWIKKIQPYLSNSFWIYVPRSNLKEFKSLDISWVDRYWVYFLIWDDENSWKLKIYIWRTTWIIGRITTHDNLKDWWQYLIFFSIEWASSLWNDEIIFLENLLINQSKWWQDIIIDNNVSWSEVQIDKASANRLSEISQQFIKILNFLWYTFTVQKMRKEDDSNIYIFKQWTDISWKWMYINWKFILKKDSVWKLESKSQLDQIKKIIIERDNYINEWKIEQKGGKIYIKEDIEFNSPHHAAKLLSLSSINWRDVRKNKKTWKSIKDEENS